MTTYRLVAYDEAGQETQSWEVQALPLRPQDVLIVKIAGNQSLPTAQLESMHQQFREALPGQRILVVLGDVSFFRLEQTQ